MCKSKTKLATDHHCIIHTELPFYHVIDKETTWHCSTYIDVIYKLETVQSNPIGFLGKQILRKILREIIWAKCTPLIIDFNLYTTFTEMTSTTKSNLEWCTFFNFWCIANHRYVMAMIANLTCSYCIRIG